MFNLTNYFDHPTRPGYTVFRFYKQQRAEYFEQLLTEKKIWFESSKEGNAYLFGVKKGDHKAVLNANYLVSGRYRKKTIPNKIVRLIFYLLVIVGLTLAVIGVIIKT